MTGRHVGGRRCPQPETRTEVTPRLDPSSPTSQSPGVSPGTCNPTRPPAASRRDLRGGWGWKRRDVTKFSGLRKRLAYGSRGGGGSARAPRSTPWRHPRPVGPAPRPACRRSWRLSRGRRHASASPIPGRIGEGPASDKLRVGVTTTKGRPPVPGSQIN